MSTETATREEAGSTHTAIDAGAVDTGLLDTGVLDPEPLDTEAVRRDFPILRREVHGHPLVYFDNAASAQRPEQVLEAVNRCYREYYSNVHRGVHELSQRSSEAYEAARERVRRFLGARLAEEIVFVRGTTEAINLVAQSYGRKNVRAGDEILLTEMEHHSNIVPWQQLCEEVGAKLEVVPVDDQGDLIQAELERLITERTKIVAVTHVSNSLGTINPIRQIVKSAHRSGAVVVVDGAQAVQHLAVDVAALDCDFFAFSGHKAYGPSGIGVLYGKKELLESMPPWQGGGGMIQSVTFERTLYADSPHRFEAGTPNIAGAIGLGAALDYLDELGFERLDKHERQLLERTLTGLSEIEGVRVLGRPRERVGVVSFLIDNVHAHDVGTLLDREGIAARVGHHCNQPLMERFGITATTRVSFGVFNTLQEVDRLILAVRHVVEFFR